MHSALPKRELLGKLAVAGVRTAAELQPAAAARVSWGVAEVDALTGGLPRGALTEVVGQTSSGRTSLLLAALAQILGRGEVCALVDASDSFDPHSAAAAGVRLERLLWVRCGFSRRHGAGTEARALRVSRGRSVGKPETTLLEQALKATDLLLQGGGFGLVAVDLGDMAAAEARRVPLTSWFRFRRAVEHTPTVLLVLEAEAHAKTCASLVVRTVNHGLAAAVVAPSHANVFPGLSVEVELVRSRVEADEGGRKPAQAVRFASRAEWTG
jgi:hypothetical protein